MTELIKVGETLNAGENSKTNSMNKLSVIKEQEVLGQNFRVYGDFENPLFLAKDVAEWVGHSNVTDMISRIDTDEVTKLNLGGLQGECNFLTENGLYEVLMLSRKPIAKQFKKEVKRILHEIRTTGKFQIPQTLSQALLLASKQAEQIEEQQRILQAQKPKVEYFDNLVDRGLNINFRDTAKEIGVKPKQLMSFLFDNRYIYRDAKGIIKPYSEHSDLFVIKEYSNSKHKGNQTLTTPKGRQTFKMLLNKSLIVA